MGAVIEAGLGFGGVRADNPRKINVEFVSANPTGPLTGNARGAFVGDLLCRVLEGVGHEVTREYYFNDFNAQVLNLGLSVKARREGREVPEDGYHGEYVADLAARCLTKSGPLQPPTGPMPARSWADGPPSASAGIEESLANLGVRFDVWTSEGRRTRRLGRSRRRPAAASGHIFEADGATWFRSTTFATTRTGRHPLERPAHLLRRTSATSRRSSAAASTS